MEFKIVVIVVLAAVGMGAAFIALGGLPVSTAATSKYLTGAATTGAGPVGTAGNVTVVP